MLSVNLLSWVVALFGVALLGFVLVYRHDSRVFVQRLGVCESELELQSYVEARAVGESRSGHVSD